MIASLRSSAIPLCPTFSACRMPLSYAGLVLAPQTLQNLAAAPL